jgi:hypothetical protein
MSGKKFENAYDTTVQRVARKELGITRYSFPIAGHDNNDAIQRGSVCIHATLMHINIQNTTKQCPKIDSETKYWSSISDDVITPLQWKHEQ